MHSSKQTDYISMSKQFLKTFKCPIINSHSTWFSSVTKAFFFFFDMFGNAICIPLLTCFLSVKISNKKQKHSHAIFQSWHFIFTEVSKIPMKFPKLLFKPQYSSAENGYALAFICQKIRRKLRKWNVNTNIVFLIKLLGFTMKIFFVYDKKSF